jgi:hypothetical protein
MNLEFSKLFPKQNVQISTCMVKLDILFMRFETSFLLSYITTQQPICDAGKRLTY